MIFKDGHWVTRSLAGNKWSVVSNPAKRRFILNSYRVLLSRAREGLVVWVPRGDDEDHTRRTAELDNVANCLLHAGADSLD